MMEDEKEKLREDQDEQIVNDAFQHLLDCYLASRHRKKVDIITKAFNFARQAHKGVRRLSGEPYILHPIAVAQIACEEVGLGSTSICAALLHDVVEDTDYTTEDIENIFGPKIAQIVDGLTKISGGIFGEQASAQAENFKKLLLTMSEDIRVILIKICDRLHNMRTLQSQPANKQYKIAGETLYIYAPLSNRLGLYKIKSELENLSFQYEHPDEYNSIKAKLASTEAKRHELFDQFTAPIEESLRQMGVKYQIKERVKTPYSIWNKMQNKHVTFDEVYDILAVRIIFTPDKREEEINECFNIYVAISKIYKSHPDRLRDWLSHPKANGYQALHVTLMSKQGRWIEVQIRSDRMDEIAEQGFAAHWKYKDGMEKEFTEDENELNDWLRTIKEILDDPQPDAMDFLDAIKLNLFASEIFVFTPKGEIKTMPTGCTALDFAFSIHTFLGSHCIGAKVNHKLVPLSHKLKSGDQVEILTSSQQKPRQEWLSIVKTSRAKSKIRLALKETQVKEGLFAKEMLERKFKNRKIEQEEATMFHVIKKLGFKEVSDFYKQIADGQLDVNTVIDKYVELKEGEKVVTGDNMARSASEFDLDESRFSQMNAHMTDDTLVIDRDLKGLDYQLARCCHPIYGDPIFGFVTINGGIKIHRQDCPNAPELRRRYGYRIVKAKWSGKGSSQYSITLRVIGNDDIGIVNNLTSIISKDERLVLRSINIDSHDGLFSGNLVVMLEDTSRLEALIKKLRTVKGVKQVERI